jgi:hypothetical protein
LNLIVKFASASPNDLCALDATSRAFGPPAEPIWAQRATGEFGVRKERGKLAWRQGLALTNGAKCVFFGLHDLPPNISRSLGGTVSMAGSSSVIAVTTGRRVSAAASGAGTATISSACAVRGSLPMAGSFRSPIGENWRIAVCGMVGSEIVAVSNDAQLALKRGDVSMDVDWSLCEPDDEIRGRLLGQEAWAIIGSETHLLAHRAGKLYVFKIEQAR